MRAWRCGAAFLLRRPHRCGAAGRRGPGSVRAVRREVRRRAAARPRRLRHEGRHRRLRRGRAATPWPGRGSISLLITGDEEGPATDGTVRVLDWMAANGQVPDFCLVGEPTNPTRSATSSRSAAAAASTPRSPSMGRRATSPIRTGPTTRSTGWSRALARCTAAPLDAGSDWFEPTTLQVTSIDVGNPATNVIPAAATARAEHPLQRPPLRRRPWTHGCARRWPSTGRGSTSTSRSAAKAS